MGNGLETDAADGLEWAGAEYTQLCDKVSGDLVDLVRGRVIGHRIPDKKW